jgi:pantoate--beta-alanine ligase
MKALLFTKLQEWRDYRNQQGPEQTLGLVPTMGNLHLGHLSLVERALSENDKVLVTIFVNPKQFGPNEDFDHYPKTLDQDIQKIEERFPEREVLIFAPQSIEEIYPEGFSTSVYVNGLTTGQLCGESRPGHFEGVTTIVYKLFSLSRAHRAYFGQKDYQQFKVIEQMVIDLDISIELYSCPIVREENGLALSSRNQFLSSSEKETALGLISSLQECRKLFNKDHEFINQEKLEKIKTMWSKNLRWDYLELRDADDLGDIGERTNSIVALAAAYIGRTRLIDNLIFEHPRGQN